MPQPRYEIFKVLLPSNHEVYFLLSVALNLYLAYFIAKRFYYSRVPPILWKYDVALIGDSHVYRGDWNKLLPCSSANFGKGKDSLQGMYNRMAGVLNCQPKVCVIHGGINDVINNIPPDTTMKYYRLIIERLREAGIKPIIIPVMRPAYHKYDDKIEALNNRINSLASELGVSVRYVDITNDDLQQDELHLNGAGYQKWAMELEDVLGCKRPA